MTGKIKRYSRPFELTAMPEDPSGFWMKYEDMVALDVLLREVIIWRPTHEFGHAAHVPKGWLERRAELLGDLGPEKP